MQGVEIEDTLRQKLDDFDAYMDLIDLGTTDVGVSLDIIKMDNPDAFYEPQELKPGPKDFQLMFC